MIFVPSNVISDDVALDMREEKSATLEEAGVCKSTAEISEDAQENLMIAALPN